MVFEARTLRMNCFTVHNISYGSMRLDGEVNLQELMAASWTPIRGDGVIGWKSRTLGYSHQCGQTVPFF